MISHLHTQPFGRIVAWFAKLLLIIPILLAVCAYAAAFDGKVLNYQEKQIYHSPDTPGFTCWVEVWQMPNQGPIQCTFTQKTGPMDNPVTSMPVLQSNDKGQTWNRVAGDVPVGASHGMVVLSDGTIVRPVWNGDPNGAGYTQRSTDGGRTWDAPVHFVSSSQHRAWPTLIKPLSDGRLVLMAGIWLRDGTNEPGEKIQKTMFVSADRGKTWGSPIELMPLSVGNCEESDFAELPNGNLLWIHRTSHAKPDGSYSHSDRMQSITRKVGDTFVADPSSVLPWPHSGFPCVLMTHEGIILDLCNTGSHWSADNGATWHNLTALGETLATHYYPRALQTTDGTIVIISHVGGDDVYGAVDQSIYQQTFRISAAVPKPAKD